MLAPVAWIREFVDFDFTAEELVRRLTMVGLEVKTVEKFAPSFSGIKIAGIIDAEPVPGQDSLRLCRIDIGDGDSARVVCGAPNAKPGLLTAWAPPGGRLPGGKEMKTEVIHGQTSEGMLCSPAELGLSADAARLVSIQEQVRPGDDLIEAFELDDHVLDLDLNPNRPDCLGILGIAREVSVITGARLRLPSFRVHEAGPPVEELSDIRIEDPDMCPRYVLRIISGGRVEASPLRIARRLLTCGLRPINNLVDVTNYVMMELGQPLHAFDLDKLKEERIVVRRANPGEYMTTLDGYEQKLAPDVLVIADAERAVAVAGVMGGEASGITENTRRVLLESARFDPGTIRRGARFLGLSTDSSHRFERGVDVEMAPKASDRAAGLIARLSGGKVAAGRIDAYPKKLESVTVNYRPDRASAVLGCKIPSGEQKRILRRLGFTVGPIRAGRIGIGVPSFRVDMDREIDLIEEVGRHYGYQRIPARLFAGIDIPQSRTEIERLREQLTEIMVGFGFTQVLTSSFVNQTNWSVFNEGSSDRQGVALRNPISVEQAFLRPSLLPTLIEAVGRNLNAGLEDVRLFEIGTIFKPLDGERRPRETERLTAVLTGRQQPPSWVDSGRTADLFVMKGIAEGILDALRISSIRFREDKSPQWAGSFLILSSDDAPICSVGGLAAEWLETMEIDRPVLFLDLRLEALMERAAAGPSFRPFSRFPSAKRDLALVVPDNVPAQDVVAIIRQVGGDKLESLHLFDFYRGPQIGSGSRSLAYSLNFRDPEQTLTDQEIDSVVERILDRLKKEYGIKLRS